MNIMDFFSKMERKIGYNPNHYLPIGLESNYSLCPIKNETFSFLSCPIKNETFPKIEIILSILFPLLLDSLFSNSQNNTT